MSRKLNFSNSRALEGSRARQRTWTKPNFEFCLPFLTTDQTQGTLTNSGHTVCALVTLKFYVPSTIDQSAYPPPAEATPRRSAARLCCGWDPNETRTLFSEREMFITGLTRCTTLKSHSSPQLPPFLPFSLRSLSLFRPFPSSYRFFARRCG